MNIKRSSMEYNEKIMRELFNYVRYQNVIYVCHHRCPVRRHRKDESRPNQESVRLYCEFILK
jgi:hypothetical protein